MRSSEPRQIRDGPDRLGEYENKQRGGCRGEFSPAEWSMQYKVFMIPAQGDPDLEDELNKFLRSHRVVAVKSELIGRENMPGWCFCVEYMDGVVASGRTSKEARPDYKEMLNEEDFAVFAGLRTLRKDMAAEEGKPVYAICTNEQLAQLARTRPQTIDDFKKISGLGDARAEAYGERILAHIKGMQ